LCLWGQPPLFFCLCFLGKETKLNNQLLLHYIVNCRAPAGASAPVGNPKVHRGGRRRSPPKILLVNCIDWPTTSALCLFCNLRLLFHPPHMYLLFLHLFLFIPQKQNKNVHWTFKIFLTKKMQFNISCTAHKNWCGGLVQHGTGEKCLLLCRTSPLIRSVRYGIGQFCLIQCWTGFLEGFVRRGIKNFVRSHVKLHPPNELTLIGQIVWLILGSGPVR
jgi:hypothetical protein